MDEIPLLLTFAVADEARPLRRQLADHPLPPGLAPRLLLTGIGPRHARHTLENFLATTRPRLVISSGFAGGLNPAFPAGAVLHDVTQAPEIAPALKPCPTQPARFHTTTRVILTPEAKARLRDQTGADAVEMESGPLREVCQARGIPCAVIRAISDASHEALPLDFNRFLTSTGQVSLPRLLGHLALHPSRVPALMHLQRSSRRAAQRLAAVLAPLIHQLARSPAPQP